MEKTIFTSTESGSQKVQHHFGGFKHKSETISITKMVNSENSSDLERVAATRSIAVEFSEFTILVIELQRCENTAFHFHAAPFGARSPRKGKKRARVRDRPMSPSTYYLGVVGTSRKVRLALNKDMRAPKAPRAHSNLEVGVSQGGHVMGNPKTARKRP